MTARIKKINIIGNHAFDKDDVTDDFELSPSGFLSFISKDDQYSRQKLAGDLEKLRSFYLDRGYINFKIESTQVTISPDKKDIYVTINITEGEVYTIRDIKLAGDLATRSGVVLSRAEIGELRSDATKRHLLDEARRVVEGGALLLQALVHGGQRLGRRQRLGHRLGRPGGPEAPADRLCSVWRQDGHRRL